MMCSVTLQRELQEADAKGNALKINKAFMTAAVKRVFYLTVELMHYVTVVMLVLRVIYLQGMAASLCLCKLNDIIICAECDIKREAENMVLR